MVNYTNRSGSDVNTAQLAQAYGTVYSFGKNRELEDSTGQMWKLPLFFCNFDKSNHVLYIQSVGGGRPRGGLQVGT